MTKHIIGRGCESGGLYIHNHAVPRIFALMQGWDRDG